MIKFVVNCEKNQIIYTRYEYSELQLILYNYASTIYVIAIIVLQNRAARIDQSVSQTNEMLLLKKQMVRLIGHEVRTPLNTVFMGLEYLESQILKQEAPDVKLIEILSDCKRSCDDAVEILNQLMLYDKFDSDLVVLDRSVIRVKSFIEDCMKPFYLQARQGNINLELMYCSFEEEKDEEEGEGSLQPRLNSNLNYLDEAFLYVDRRKLSIVLRNMLSNALKFVLTSSVRNITVRVSCIRNASSDSNTIINPPLVVASGDNEDVIVNDPDFSLRVEMIDTGPGISPENLKRLFNEVIQFNPERLQAGGGSGLGLWISHQIMKLHNGRLYAQSEGEGYGCTFIMVIYHV